MRVVILGGSGFIGTALTRHLTARGDEVIIPSRHPSDFSRPLPNRTFRSWDGRSVKGLIESLEGADGVVNLLGENIAAGKWNAEQKKRIVQSRLDAGNALVEALETLEERPQTLIQASASGYYGFWPDAASAPDCTEETGAGAGFLAATAIQWEGSTQKAEQFGIRRCIIRTAPVLSPEGGMLSKIIPLFRLGLGGPVGSGKQPFAWIHLEDEVAAIAFLLDHGELSGPFNLVAPEHATMSTFVHALAKALHRPAWLPVPGAVLRLAFGEMATELLLAGQKVSPVRLLEHGFLFRRSTLASALAFS